MITVTKLIDQYKQCSALDHGEWGRAALELCIEQVNCFPEGTPLTAKQLLILLKGITKLSGEADKRNFNLADLSRLTQCAFIILWVGRDLPSEDLNEALRLECIEDGGRLVLKKIEKITDYELEELGNERAEVLLFDYAYAWSSSHRQRLIHERLRFLHSAKGITNEAYCKIVQDVQGQADSNHRDFEQFARIFHQRPVEGLEARAIELYDNIKHYSGYQDILFFIPSEEGAMNVVDVLVRECMGLAEKDDQDEMTVIIKDLLHSPVKIMHSLLFFFKELRGMAGTAKERVEFAKYYRQLISFLIKEEKDDKFTHLFMLFLSRSVRKEEWGGFLPPDVLSLIERTKGMPQEFNLDDISSIALNYLRVKPESFLSVDSVLQFFAAIVDSDACLKRIQTRRGGVVLKLIEDVVFPMIRHMEVGASKTSQPEKRVVILSQLLQWVENTSDDMLVRLLPDFKIELRNSFYNDVPGHLKKLTELDNCYSQLDRSNCAVVKEFFIKNSEELSDPLIKLSLIEGLLRLNVAFGESITDRNFMKLFMKFLSKSVPVAERAGCLTSDALLSLKQFKEMLSQPDRFDPGLSFFRRFAIDYLSGEANIKPVSSYFVLEFFNGITEIHAHWMRILTKRNGDVDERILDNIFEIAGLKNNSFMRKSENLELSLKIVSCLLQWVECYTDEVIVKILPRLAIDQEAKPDDVPGYLENLMKRNIKIVMEAEYNMVADAFNALRQISSRAANPIQLPNEGTSGVSEEQLSTAVQNEEGVGMPLNLVALDLSVIAERSRTLFFRRLKPSEEVGQTAENTQTDEDAETDEDASPPPSPLD